jgi:predicted  nucleic acid-binding Zn-ribbon protein
MTDENNQAPTIESLQAQLETSMKANTDLQTQFTAVKNKSEELLTETKAAKQKAREASDAREATKLEKARKDGDYEQLLSSSEAERKTLKEQLETLTNRVSHEKVNSVSLKVAGELADGSNAEIMSEFISKRIKLVDGEVKVLDSSGNLTVSTIDDLKNEFIGSDKFKSLLRGTKSNGGGASGSKSTSDSSKQISRSQFDSLSQSDRMKFSLDNGKVVDD